MKFRNIAKLVGIVGLAGAMIAAANSSDTSPAQDREALRGVIAEAFPDLDLADLKDGIYAIDEGQREQWEEIEEFPPYEIAIDEGRALFETPFADGETYAACFENGGIGIRQNYPYYDIEAAMVKTLELAINECRAAHGEKPLKYKKGKMAAISAYMAYTSRGNMLNTSVPDDAGAMQAYLDGKEFFYSKRGQLNFSCADCHVANAGRNVRADRLSPTLGHPTHFPVYRSKWGDMGTLHRRFDGCNANIRATALPAQGEAYRNLEFFMSVMSAGMEINGPGARK